MRQLGTQLFYAMFDLMQSMHRFEITGPLTKSTLLMLLVIQESEKENAEKGVAGGVTASSLSCELDISKPAVTKAVNYLEERGYVTRINGQSDRRQVYVMLTPEGEKVLREARETVMQNMEQLVQGLGEADTEAFIRLSERMARACERLRLS